MGIEHGSLLRRMSDGGGSGHGERTGIGDGQVASPDWRCRGDGARYLEAIMLLNRDSVNAYIYVFSRLKNVWIGAEPKRPDSSSLAPLRGWSRAPES